MAIRLSPKDDGFFDLFGGVAAHAVAAVEMLSGLLAVCTDDERRSVAKRLGEIEKAADEVTHEIIRRVNASFVTPLDRDDLHRLATSLDECIDDLDRAADLVKVHRIGDFSARLARQVDVLSRMATLTLEAMPRLRQVHELTDYWIEINRLENQAAKNHRRLVADILDEHSDNPVLAFRHILIADALAAAVGSFERVAHTIEGIAVKET